LERAHASVRPLLASLLALLLTAPAALASPGGGSSGFGGGGSSGGGGFSGGGGGVSGGGGSTGGGFIVVLFIAFVLIAVALAAFASWKYRRRRAARVRQVTLAAAEAADDDAAFAADAIATQAAELHRAIVAAWTARDRDALAGLLGADLMVEWRRRLDDFDRKGWHNVTEIEHGPAVEYIGLTNREDDAEDRVVVRMQALLRDVVLDRHGAVITRNDSSSQTTTLAEYWTLGKRDGRWILLSIEQDAEGRHQLDAPIVASPWGDARLHDEALTELATADAVAATALAEITPLDMDGDARAAALDLSLVDGRYAPDVLEAAARRAVAAWAEAVDGDDAPLEAVADRAAIDALLYPGDPTQTTRLVVRGPRLEGLRITGIEGRTMTVEADVTGRRYRENRDTLALVEGSRDRAARFTERWTLALTDDADAPWRLVGP
jgi:predicted lipid-binding transport protein (Tim44 family)